MASQVRKNVENPTHILYHHGFTKMIILAELKKKNQVWEQFLYELSNSHINSPLVNEASGPLIPDLIDKASSVNASKCQTSHIQEQEVKSCKKAGRSHIKKPRGSKGQQVNSQLESGKCQSDCGKFLVSSTRSMVAQEKKIGSKGKTLVHV